MIIKDVSKRYKEYDVLKSINITLIRGEIYGLLGPNGAGKSTLLKCIIGLVTPDSGKIFIDGKTIDDDRSEFLQYIGYVPDTPFIYNYLTPKEYLDFIADLQQVPDSQKTDRIQMLLKNFSLKDKENEMISTLSFGMKHKLSVAGAIIHEPDVLLLDEPLSSFDPPTTMFMKKFLREYADSGKIIFMSTHLVHVAQNLCDRVGVLINGEILKEYTNMKNIINFENMIINDMEEIG